MENRWDMIENCAYASLSNRASFTKEEHKKMISKNQALVFPSVFNGNDFMCVEMTNKDNGRKYILACGNEDSWFTVRYEFKIRQRWTTNKLSIRAAINTAKRENFAGVCFVFNQDMIWFDIDDLESMDKTNEILTFIVASVRGVPLDATNESGKTCLVVAEDETTMEKFVRQILGNNPQTYKDIKHIQATRQQIHQMVSRASHLDGIVVVDSCGSTTMIGKTDLNNWSKETSSSLFDMIASKVISSNICRDILQGIKTPHSTSQPVIRYENGKCYLASFVFFYNREDIEAGEVDRPSFWAIADIQTGEIVERRYTSDIEFSNAQYDVKYNVRADGKYNMSNEYYDKTYALLDSVREKLLKTGKVDMSEYKEYIQRIIANIPRAYRRFYLDLSFIPSDL